MPKKKCRIQSEGKKGCKKEYYASIKVQVRHSDTGRKSFQTWHLCKDHYFGFLKLNGEGYYSWYHKKPFKKAFVTGYNIIGMI